MNEKWLQQEVNQLLEQAQTFEEKAYYQALKVSIKQLNQRIDQKKGELDGRIWNATKW